MFKFKYFIIALLFILICFSGIVFSLSSIGEINIPDNSIELTPDFIARDP